MRILQLHSNSVIFKPISKEIKLAEETEEREVSIEEVLLLLTAVEEGDDEATAKKAVPSEKVREEKRVESKRSTASNKTSISSISHSDSSLRNDSVRIL